MAFEGPFKRSNSNHSMILWIYFNSVIIKLVHDFHFNILSSFLLTPLQSLSFQMHNLYFAFLKRLQTFCFLLSVEVTSVYSRCLFPLQWSLNFCSGKSLCGPGPRSHSKVGDGTGPWAGCSIHIMLASSSPWVSQSSWSWGGCQRDV